MKRPCGEKGRRLAAAQENGAAATRPEDVERRCLQVFLSFSGDGIIIPESSRFAAVARYPCKHTEGVLWMAVWLVACGNKH